MLLTVCHAPHDAMPQGRWRRYGSIARTLSAHLRTGFAVHPFNILVSSACRRSGLRRTCFRAGGAPSIVIAPGVFPQPQSFKESIDARL
jgi:hypothetical protein